MQTSFVLGSFEDARKVRISVFMEEQGFENEFDHVDEDPRTLHVAVYCDGELAGCCRVFPATDEPGADGDNAWVFGRLAVLPEFRHAGLGSLLLVEAERLACERGADRILLHAQCAAAGFYERAGYEAYGPVEFDEHVEHRWMAKDVLTL